MHEMGDINALYFHDVPVIGSFYQHGVAHYNTSFFKVMASIQKYEMIYAFLTEYGDDDNLSVVVTAYTKTELNPFMSFEEFCLLPGLESAYSDFRFRSVRVDFYSHTSSLYYVLQVDTMETNSLQLETNFCDQYLQKITEALGPMEREICISEVAERIEKRKIVNYVVGLNSSIPTKFLQNASESSV